ncbi:MAG: DUF2207 domain-containing protein [Chloroflexota bacterium]
MRRWHMYITALLLLLLSACGSGNPDQSFQADQFESVVTVKDNGAIQVTEMINFRFEEGSFTFVFREIPTANSNGISILEASVDEVVYPIGNEAGQIEVQERRNNTGFKN